MSSSFTAVIESLDQEGRGIARLDGKTVFVEGALTGETVIAQTLKRKPSWELAHTEQVLTVNSDRTTPRCPHFGICGGCSLQHATPALQVAAKQRTLEEALKRIGNVRADQLLPPIHGPAWGYRYRARLSVRHVFKKGGVLVGFHERKSSYVADMRECPVLPPPVSALLLPLRELVESLSIRDRLPQIEVAVGESLHASSQAPDDSLTCVLVLRILEALNDNDEKLLRTFADRHRIAFWLQTGGPDTVQPFHPKDSALSYSLPEFAVSLPFAPTEFTQVNHDINRVLVRRALALLDPQPGERVADFFCGLGNFTLPIARSGAHVTGIEGSPALIRRAEQGAQRNGLARRCAFLCANLFNATPETLAPLLPLNKILIDPPREGALELVKALPHASDTSEKSTAVRRIVYVSCNPATLARDASVLVHERGYALRAAGIVNMFPHTAHVESIAVFEPAATAVSLSKSPPLQSKSLREQALQGEANPCPPPTKSISGAGSSSAAPFQKEAGVEMGFATKNDNP
ncbi:MAG: 23S rRNA (uracil(1939)-C(5))-methyltransferase RlmD [Burkholderiales bacterium]|jgi:23S rRNA (uracil1939-C5)-methyltransferase|nr:23S rRNA (uracil(1939)-C(5))-methyltransferase RlmD [Burkholderiales bacterium]